MSLQRNLLFVLATITASSAHAVSLNPGGVGQVLVFPYYTANANQETLITLVNPTPHVKALKLRFHEAYNGRTVSQFNLYLSPFDVWTAEVVADGTGTSLATRDTSCTVPAFSSMVTGTSVAALPFSAASFTGDKTDGGPTAASRLREGHFDVLEMGEVTGDDGNLQLAAIHDNGVPQSCPTLVKAWNEGGIWSHDTATAMSPPAGGLYGSSAVIDVSQGTFFVTQPAALDGFSSIVQHSAPDFNTPDLNTPGVLSHTGTLASVDVGGRVVNAHYTFSADAVSALFMAATQLNEFVLESSIGAKTDWIVTFPTKRFYVDPLFGSPDGHAPFDAAFSDGTSCSNYGLQQFNREEMTIVPGGVFFTGTASAFCHETSVVALAPDGTSALHSALKEQNNVPLIPLFTEGHLIVDMTQTNAAAPRQLAASTEGYVLSGLPAMGFVAEDYVNANVTAGVLANYSGAYPHHSTVRCGMGSGASQPCQ